MLNGKYDFYFPVESAQKPFFEHLGTPADQKKYLVYEGGHDVPRTELIKETSRGYIDTLVRFGEKRHGRPLAQAR